MNISPTLKMKRINIEENMLKEAIHKMFEEFDIRGKQQLGLLDYVVGIGKHTSI